MRTGRRLSGGTAMRVTPIRTGRWAAFYSLWERRFSSFEEAEYVFLLDQWCNHWGYNREHRDELDGEMRAAAAAREQSPLALLRETIHNSTVNRLVDGGSTPPQQGRC